MRSNRLIYVFVLSASITCLITFIKHDRFADTSLTKRIRRSLLNDAYRDRLEGIYNWVAETYGKPSYHHGGGHEDYDYQGNFTTIPPPPNMTSTYYYEDYHNNHRNDNHDDDDHGHRYGGGQYDYDYGNSSSPAPPNSTTIPIYYYDDHDERYHGYFPSHGKGGHKRHGRRRHHRRRHSTTSTSTTTTTSTTTAAPTGFARNVLFGDAPEGGAGIRQASSQSGPVPFMHMILVNDKTMASLHYADGGRTLVRCQLWDLEKLGRQAAAFVSSSGLPAQRTDFRTMMELINRCREMSERSITYNEDTLIGDEALIANVTTGGWSSFMSLWRGLIPGECV